MRGSILPKAFIDINVGVNIGNLFSTCVNTNRIKINNIKMSLLATLSKMFKYTLFFCCCCKEDNNNNNHLPYYN